jgi:hypothetical protein
MCYEIPHRTSHQDPTAAQFLAFADAYRADDDIVCTHSAIVATPIQNR